MMRNISFEEEKFPANYLKVTVLPRVVWCSVDIYVGYSAVLTKCLLFNMLFLNSWSWCSNVLEYNCGLTMSDVCVLEFAGDNAVCILN